MSPNPYAPPVSPSPGGAKSADVHRIVNAVLILGGSLVGAFALLLKAVQLGGLAPPPTGLPANTNESYAMGAATGRALWVGWALVALVGGPVVAYGLLAKRPWAARWARNYWLLSLFSCCFTLPSIYGLFSTTRPTFRELFERS
jgi:hypothetical protein